MGASPTTSPSYIRVHAVVWAADRHTDTQTDRQTDRHTDARDPSANLECRSEMCCTQLAGKAGPKKSPKICHLGTITQLCQAISSQLRHVSTIGKKVVKEQYLPHVLTIW